MNHFQKLFGIPSNEIKKTCVLTPYLTKDLLRNWQIKFWHKGLRYGSGNNDRFTLVHTHIGAGFVGDAVLYLAHTPCQQLVFFGSAGIAQETKELKFGSLALIQESYCLESFTQLLCDGIPAPLIRRPDEKLLKSFSAESKIPFAKCASFGSLFLESQCTNFLFKEKIDVLDMETSAFFAATGHINKPGIAIVYITDRLNSDDLSLPRTAEQNKILLESIRLGQQLIDDFVGRGQ